jgi:hypothetical protein
MVFLKTKSLQSSEIFCPLSLDFILTLLSSAPPTTPQLADTVERKTGAHLEYESTTWMQAFSLALPLASTCSVIIMQVRSTPHYRLG